MQQLLFFTGATNTGSSRGSLISSYALKGRVLLYEGNYSESAIASRKALDIKSALDSNYGNIFLSDATLVSGGLGVSDQQ
jgi:hypothetical protein